MKSIYILIIGVVCLLPQNGAGFLYKKENRYSSFLKQYKGIGEVSGLNLKITEENLDGLVDKLVDENEGEEMDQRLFDFKEESDMGDFDDVDLTNWGEGVQKEDENDFILLPTENIKVTTKFIKRECFYSRIFVTSGKNNTQRSFMKVHESSGIGGKIDSTVSGTPSTQIKTDSKGSMSSGINATIYSEGKKYKTRVTATTKVDSTETDKASDKKWHKIISTSVSTSKSSVTQGNKTMALTVTGNVKAETFKAPFRVFLTLFESSFDINGNKMDGKVRGEVTSRVVFAKKGKSLTKCTLRGFVTTEGETFCSIKMFKIWSHIWIKPESKEIANEDEIEVNGTINVDVFTYSKGRVYGKAEAGKEEDKHAKIFYGAGLASFEKARVTIPLSIKGHEQGVHFMSKSLLERHLSTLKMQFVSDNSRVTN